MNILWSKTGSDGNCSVIELSDKSIFMIDAGVKLDIVNKKIGYKLSQIKKAFVTHMHKDHSGYIDKLLTRGITVYMPINSVPNLPNKDYYIKGIKSEQLTFDNLIVRPFPLIHTNGDGTNCENYGYLFLDKGNGEKMLWATDTHFIPQKFPPCEIYALECNYSDAEENIDYLESEHETKELIVEKRRLVSHQSLEALLMFLKKQDLSKCREIRLLHISGAEKQKLNNWIDRIFKELGNKLNEGVTIIG